MELTRSFAAITKEDATTAGGKGASLGEMTQAGIPVPEGFVLLSNAFERFLEETDLLAEIDATLEIVNKQEMHTIEHASEKIQRLILNAKMPADIATEIETHFMKLGSVYVAVRSSATAEDSASAAWAGQLDSYLNTTKDTLLKNVQRCWASLFTPRAIFYRFEKELYTTKISVAVVIQKMVASEISGIAFSVHPVTEDRNQLIIEAGYGLGEAIVQGQITPDSYVVEKEPRKIIDVNINTQTKALYRATNGGNEWRDIAQPKASAQVLTGDQILDLAKLIVRIENHYGFPCDIEWVFESSKFYIVQSRPITTLLKKDHAGEDSPEDRLDPKVLSIKKEDYTYGYGAGGTFILQESVSKYYLPHFIGGKTITIFINKECVMYFSNTLVQAMKNTGLIRTHQELNQKIDSLKELSLQVKSELAELKKVKKVHQNDLAKAYKYVSESSFLYSYFDIRYWDEVFIKSVSDEKYRDIVVLFESYKNQAKLELNSIWIGKDSYFDTLLQKISEQFLIGTEDLEWYAEEDLFNLVAHNRPASQNEISKRKNNAVFLSEETGCTIFLDKDAEFLVEMFKISSDDSETIKGEVANGKNKKVVGVVFLMENYSPLDPLQEKMEKMNKGDILVSETTSPELMPAFHKAMAVITDTGGMLSHAAITSRELGLPCIVNTRDASKILKTGDEIEMNLFTGEVRILNKV